ncbi:MAG: hypothetical protein O9353_08935, partial [Bacteroidia bacterium]|nr:hypothetical protein [Bacteroidia bacterium]
MIYLQRIVKKQLQVLLRYFGRFGRLQIHEIKVANFFSHETISGHLRKKELQTDDFLRRNTCFRNQA